MKKKNKIKKSQILLVGSFLIFVGVVIFSYGHLKVLKEEVYEEVRLSLLDHDMQQSEKVTDASDVTNLGPEDTTNNSLPSSNAGVDSSKQYSYIGYLEIPKIRLKRGFLKKESKYNDIEHNIMVSYNADYPDVKNGNFILIAHSGDAYISFFAYLYKLKEGDLAYVTYQGTKYQYQLVKIEEQAKTGVVAIHRPNYNVNGLTLITCTKDNDYAQSIYIFERI